VGWKRGFFDSRRSLLVRKGARQDKPALPAQILLDESWTQMNVDLDERAIPDGFEAVNLAGLDDENVPRATFKRLSVHGPYSAAFPDKLDLIVGMPMRAGTLARQPTKQKHADAHVSLLGADKFV